MEFLKIEPREYQIKIAETCLNKNCLVVLPTGLGKTLIALMVTIERMKKFPRSKILMLAPTKPLAEQHEQYFKKNLPELFADIQLFTGAVKAAERKKIWQTADIIFSTPQCVANDLKNNLYNLEEVSLLVEDEAHRCVKNYDYNYIAKSYLEKAKNPRLIGLTASPGSDPKQIRDICKSLSIEEVELRSRNSEDVTKYLQKLEFEKIMVPFPPEFLEIKKLLRILYEEYIQDLKTKAACEHYFEKIIEACEDLIFLVIRDKKFDIPEDDLAFDILYKNKIISSEVAEKLKDAKGMRNIIAHQYGKVDDEIVFHAITDELEGDVRKFIKEILDYINYEC